MNFLSVLVVSATVLSGFWSIVLMVRTRNWHIGFLTVLLAVMGIRQAIALLGIPLPFVVDGDGSAPPIIGNPEIYLSAMALLFVLFLELMVSEHKRTEKALRDSEALYQSLVENVPQYIFRKDIEGRLTFGNTGYCRAMGKLSGELLGKTDHDLFPDEMARKFREDDMLVMKTGEVFEDVEENIRDGEVYTVQVVKTPVRDSGGRIVGIQGIFWDITARIRAEKALQRSESRLRQIIDLVPHMIFAKDEEGRFLLANRTVAKYYGTTVDVLLRHGRQDSQDTTGHSKSLHPDDREVFEHGNEKITPEEKFIDADGNVRILQATRIPLLAYGRDRPAVLGVAVDITELKRAEEALRESEEKYRNLVERANDGICILQDALVKYGNGQIAQMSGYPIDEIIGSCYTDFIHPADRDLVLKKNELHVSGKEPNQRYETGMIHRDGHRVDVEVNTGLIAYEGRRASLIFLRDITVRLAAQRALRESEERFRQLAENVNEIFWLTDWKTRRVLYVNSAFEAIRGRTRESLYENSRVWSYDIHPDDRERVLASFHHAIESGEYNEQFRIIRPDGEIRWLHERAFPIHDEEGTVYRIAGVTEDITQRKQSESELQQRDIALAHVTRLSIMGEMVAGIAHEINQPLYAIVNFAGACRSTLDLENESAQENLREWIDQIGLQAKRAGEIIRRLGGFVSKSPVQHERLNMNEVISESLELAVVDVQRYKVEVTLELDVDEPQVSGDRVQLQQVMVNLFRNSCEAMVDVLTNERWITVSSRIVEGSVEVSVQDCGSGLPDDNQETLFDAFFTTKSSGMGIGLAISRTIIETHGGKIWASSDDSGGAKFQFTLPRSSN